MDHLKSFPWSVVLERFYCICISRWTGEQPRLMTARCGLGEGLRFGGSTMQVYITIWFLGRGLQLKGRTVQPYICIYMCVYYIYIYICMDTYDLGKDWVVDSSMQVHIYIHIYVHVNIFMILVHLGRNTMMVHIYVSAYRLESGTVPNCTSTDWNSKLFRYRVEFQTVPVQIGIPNCPRDFLPFCGFQTVSNPVFIAWWRNPHSHGCQWSLFSIDDSILPWDRLESWFHWMVSKWNIIKYITNI